MNYDDVMLNALLNRQMAMGVQAFADGTEIIAPERPPLRIDIAGVGDQPSMPEDVGPAPDDVATQMAAGTEPEGATPMTLGEFATTAADVPAGLLKGGVQGSIGLPGDIISLARGLYDLGASGGSLDAFLAGLGKPTGLPTTEDMKKFFDETVGVPLVPEGADPRRAEAAKTAEFVGELGGAGQMMVQGTGAVAKVVKGISQEMATTPPRGSVQIRPTPVQTQTPVQAPRSGLGFYSVVEETVANLPQAKGSGQQFLAQIQKTSGVKPDEIKYTGLDDFLKGKKSVTKTEIQEYLNANKVDVQEVRLSDEIDPEEVRMFMADEAGEGFTYDEAVDYLRDGDSVTKFSKLTIPGGNNYREILLTLPQKTAPFDPSNVKIYRNRTSSTQGTFSIKYGDNAVGPFADKFNVADNYAGLSDQEIINVAKRMYEQGNELSGIKPMSGAFKSTHFNQPNVLAHMRVNDRTVDGKKTLFIEEIQSDWHQAGRKRGYGNAAFESAQKQHEEAKGALAQEILKLDPQANVDEAITGLRRHFNGSILLPQMTPEIEDVFKPLVNRETSRLETLNREKLSGGIPDAPFKTTWHELTLKRAIQEASEKGYDQVAFTTGKTQAERYDLSKQIKTLIYSEPDAQGLRKVEAITPSGDRLLGKRYTLNEIEDNVGKEMAEKISQSSGEFDQRTSTYAMSGLDLQVGGEGMAGFYDNILPKSLDKLGKKFDAKVGKTQMDGIEVWQMDITPKMRESVTTKGQPLFAVPAAAAAGAATMQQPEERM